MTNRLNNVIIVTSLLVLILVQSSFAFELETSGTSEVQETKTLELDIITTNYNGTTNFSKDLSKGTITKINNSLAKFEWTPTYGDAETSSKTYYFTFTVEDVTETKEITEAITVTKKNNAFSITSTTGGGSTGTESNNIVVYTNRTNTTCKYDLSEKDYSDMEFTMYTEDGSMHNGTIKFTSSGSYSVYIMCEDELKNKLDSETKINFQVTLSPKAEIYLTPSSPVRAGLTKIKLITTEPLMEAPTLTYSLTKSDAKESVTLVGSQTSWEGYMVIEESNIERVGTFEFKGLSVNNLEGTEILKNKIFIVDSEAPDAPTSIKATSQDDRIKIEWHYPPELEDQIQEFRLYRKDDSGGTDYVDYYTTTSNDYYYDEEVELNKAYYYKVSAVKKSGVEGELSKEFPITFRPEVEVTIEELEPIKRIQLESMEKKLERYVFDMNSDLKQLTEKTGAEEKFIETLGLDNEITETILKINKLNSELLDLEGQTLSDNEFESETENILGRAKSLFENSPKNIEIIDYLKNQEGYDDAKTKNIFQKYLDAQNFNISEKEVQDYVKETVELQQSATIESEKTLIRVSYGNKNKDILFVNKQISSSEATDNITVMESIPSKLTSDLKKISTKGEPTIMQKKSLLIWDFKPEEEREDISISYYIETEAGINDLQELKTIISEDKREKIKKTILSGMATGVNTSGNGGLLIPTIIAAIVLIGLATYYFLMDEKNEAKTRKWFKKIKERKMRIIPKGDKNKSNNNNNNNNSNDNGDGNDGDGDGNNGDNSSSSSIDDGASNPVLNDGQNASENKHKVFNFDTNQEDTRKIENKDLTEDQNNQKKEETIEINKIEERNSDIKEEEKKVEFNKIRNMLKEYKENLNEHENIPAHKISELYNVVSDIKVLCDDIHNDKIYNYAVQTKKELEETIQKIETQREEDEAKLAVKDAENAPQGKEFWTYTGKMLASIKDLKEELKSMPEYVFYYHVNSDRNDFANWIENIFSNRNLSEKIKNVKNKEELLKALNY